MTTSETGPARAEPARAALTVGAVETEYLRVGNGAPVLVLDPRLAATIAAGEPPSDWSGHRLIVPVGTTIAALAPSAAHPDDPFGAWLRGFLDGLGLAAVTIVVSPPLEAAVRRFADDNPGEIARILPADPGAHGG